MRKREKKGLFRRLFDAIKRFFGFGKSDEESAMQANTSGKGNAAPTDEELDSIYKDVGIDMSKVEEPEKKSGSSSIITVPSSESARLDGKTGASKSEKTEDTVEKEK